MKKIHQDKKNSEEISSDFFVLSEFTISKPCQVLEQHQNLFFIEKEFIEKKKS